MKITKKLEVELIQLIETYWDSYAKGDLQTWASFLPDNYRNIGTTQEEIWNSKEEVVNYTKAVIDQMVGNFEFRRAQLQIIPFDPNIMIHEFGDIYVRIKDEWAFYSKIRISSLLQKDKTGWKIIHQHGSYPDSKTVEGEAFAFDTIKAENIKLREAVKHRTIELEQKNRELEIEGSLERVRAQAMGMTKPEDLLSVCEKLFKELQTLGFNKIRNAIIHILNDEKGFFLDYDYSDFTGGTITNTFYNSHPILNNFLIQIKSSNDAFAEVVIDGNQLSDWKEFRRKSGQPNDSRLDNIPALYYYFYSIGIGDVGISTFNPIDENQLGILKRFRNVFELAYRRFMDIQQAEAQAKEAQIETSLERIRSRTMAMQQSSDLHEVIKVVTDQLCSLGIKFNVANFAKIHSEGSWDLWISTPEQSYPALVHVPYLDHGLFNNLIETISKGVDFLADEYDQEEKNIFFKHFFENTLAKNTPEERKQFVMNCKGLARSIFLTKNIWLAVTNYEGIPFSDEENKIFKRFAAVFEQTYTRFLDLQKAEAQTREAQIEASLEKVRASAMSMHKSEDLLNVAEILFEELHKLGFDEMRNAMINIHNDENKTFLNYDYSDEIGKSITLLNFNAHPVMEKQIRQSRIANDAFSEAVYKGKDLEEWKEFRRKYGEKDDPRINNINALYYYFYSIGSGTIGISTFNTIGEEKLELLKRFRNVFSLSYQRYSDITLAEAQAKEAKIEAALERVRSRTMGMQKSDELLEAGEILFLEMQKLGIESLTAGYVLMDKEEKNGLNYAPNPLTKKILPSPVIIPHNETVHMQQVVKNWKKGNSFFIVEMNEAETIKHQTFIAERSINFPLNAAQLIAISPAKLFLHNFYFKEGYLLIVGGLKLSAEQTDIMLRFTKVFQQTYTRFLDLQKAEAQAMEAQIEAALERVRSRTMGMQKSEELREVIRVVYEQFVHLKINVDHAGFVVDYKPKGDWHFWIADEQEIPSKITHPYFESVWANQFDEAKEKGADFFATNLNFEEKNKFYDALLSYVPGLPEASKDFYLSCPGLAASTVLLENVGLYIENFSGIPYSDEENNTLMRFGKVFQQTYTRFLDLQKAEAQAREAKIETSLERVRSKAMAMHSPNDLSETVNVFFKELKTLGIIPIRCGVGQIDESTRTTSLTTTTSSQQGESFQVIGKVKQAGHPILDGIFEHWKLQKEYHPVLEGEDIKAYYNVMNAQIGYPEYPEGVTQYGNNFFFKEGFVFAWTENLLSEEELIIFRRFTSVLSLTYRRYLDLKEAEEQAREAQIEAALERTRTQSILMQHSTELDITSRVFHEQLLLLGIPSELSFVWLPDVEKEKHLFWTTWTQVENDSTFSQSKLLIYDLDRTEHYTAECFKAWESGEPVHVYTVLPAEVKSYFDIWSELISGAAKLKPEFFPEGIYYAEAFMKYGCFGIMIGRLLTEDEKKILLRFSIEFERTYTRFLDLKKAEEQNKIIQADNDRKTKELEDARLLQLSMLPKELPQLPHLDIAVYMKTATEVGGDYYDFHVQPDGTLTALVGDATGHGMMSGMMVSIMKSFFISNRTNIELKHFFESSNNSIKDMHLGRLMMALIGVQITSEKVIATNAGMPSLLYFRNKSQKAGEFVSNNLPLGGMKDISYSLKEIRYEKGDTLLLMSDGFAELKNENDEQYGYSRLKEEFKSVAQKSPNEIVEYLKNSASKWANGVEPNDDITFVVINVK